MRGISPVMTDREGCRSRIEELLDSQLVGVLATGAGGRPYASLVAFAYTGDLERMAFATPRDSRKYSDMMENPGVALLIDDRRNEVADFQGAVAVTVMGRARESVGREREALLNLYSERHPSLENFATSASTALMVVEVERYRMVLRFQQVEELWIGAREGLEQEES
ncbi:MAG: pyridoxamine 5'-phosphate oxidase family protein [Methanomassiliicoccales archaeon]